jgi:putative DNA primase/helicase
VSADSEPQSEGDADLDAPFSFADAPPPESDDALIHRLARLPELEYERERAAAAEQLGCRAAILDRLVKQARGAIGDGAAGSPLKIVAPEPHEKPQSGARLLDDLATYFAHHVFLPAGAPDALAVWTVHTHCFALFRHSPRVAIVSPEKRCGKTTLLDALALVVCKPLPTSSVTAAAVFRAIEATRPTLLVDEADRFLAGNEELIAVINSGHKIDGQVLRCVGDEFEVRSFAVYSPAAIAAIRKLPDTILDRSIIIRMIRAMRSERRAPLDEAAERMARDLGRRCARWTQDNAEALRQCRPTMPATLYNRRGDNWRSLFAVAEIAGAEWPARIAAASAAALVPDDDADGRGIRLLADIRTVLADHHGDVIASAALCEGLLAIESSPWGEINRGRPLTPATLARMLRPFKVLASVIRMGDRTPRGYAVAAFAEAFKRYLDDDEGGEPTYEVQQRNTPQKSAKNAETKVQHGDGVLHFENPEKPQSPAACGVVALCMGETPERRDEAPQNGWEGGL